MLEWSPGDPLIKEYLRDIQHLKSQGVTKELGLRGPFQNLLHKTARKHGWTLVAERSMQVDGRRVVPDGTLLDAFQFSRGWWEQKDPDDKFAIEIQKKIKAGYPITNTIFEDTQIGVLYQDRRELRDFPLSEPPQIAALLNQFYSHNESIQREFTGAMLEFKSRIPALARDLQEHIKVGHDKIRKFQLAFADFLTLCRTSLNPDLTDEQVDEMLVQHLLTDRLISKLFRKPEFAQSNIIAAEVEKVIQALASGSFSKDHFLKQLDPYYTAIERDGANLERFAEKQDFLNSVYEQFFQKFSRNTADTHGIVYTPHEIVDYMCDSVGTALKEEFGYTLASPEVKILDPCTGTGNFIVSLIKRMPSRALPEAYANRLFANEVMLLPYYLASLNIEYAYFERTQENEAFPGLCFVDTLDMAEADQLNLFAKENTKRVGRQKKAPITVIIGNPPYNVGQKSENDNNQNRKYDVVDQRIRNTYAKDSTATNKNSLADMYVKFFRWASDRLGDRDGIVCFVSNNSFVDQMAFDGMRKHLMNDFQKIDHIDLHGNVRRNPKLSGTTHNVFGIQVGVGITLAIKKKGAVQQLRYHRVPEMWRKKEKLDFLDKRQIPWQTLSPDANHTWLVPEHADEYAKFPSMADMFEVYTVGVKTNRDAVVYDWDKDKLATRMKKFVADYNAEAYRHKANPDAYWPDQMKWSLGLKQHAVRGKLATFGEDRIRPSLYRPFAKRFLYFDRILNECVYLWPKISGRVIVTSDVGWRAPTFNALVTDGITDLHLCAAIDAHQCFPISQLKDSAVETFRRHYADQSISRESVFNYAYALLHHTPYRERYAANLKRELPRIPFAPDFWAFANAGRELARLHVDYETLKEWPLTEVETGLIFSQQVEKMILSKDKRSIKINNSLTLEGIPPETFEYRLGSRSALEWIIDQYRIKGDSDPNRKDDPGYIVRLVGQVIRVSVETVTIVNSLPDFRAEQPAKRLPATRETAARKPLKNVIG